MSDSPAKQRAAALKVLGLPSGATSEQITRAYRSLARTTHPDVTDTADASAGERFGAISAAYRRLSTAPPPPPSTVYEPVPTPDTALAMRPVMRGSPAIVVGPVVVTPLPYRPARRRFDDGR